MCCSNLTKEPYLFGRSKWDSTNLNFFLCWASNAQMSDTPTVLERPRPPDGATALL